MKFLKSSSYILIVFAIFSISITACKSTKNAKNQSNTSKKTTISDEDKLKNSALFTEACKQKILGYNSEAILIFKECINRDASNHAAMYELAGLFSSRKQYDSALFWSQKSVELDNSNIWYMQMKGELLLISKKFDEAIDTYEKIVKATPNNKDAYKDWATAAYYSKKYAKAIDIYNKIEEKFGISYEIFISKSQIYEFQNNLKDAIIDTKRIISKHPEETVFYQYLASLYVKQKEYTKAFEVYQQILKIDSLNTDVNFLLSDYYRAIGEKEKSYFQLKKAFENPYVDYEEKAKILFSYYDLTGQYPELKKQAIELSQILTKVHANNFVSFTIYADFLYQNNQKQLARDEYRKAFALDSSKFLIIQQIMFCSSSLSDDKSLLLESNQAISIFPEQALSYLFNAYAYFGLNKNPEALKTLQNGLIYITDDKDPLTEQYYSTLGDAYYKNNEFAKTFEIYEKALKINPLNAYVLNNYSYYLSLRNENLDKSLDMAKKAIKIEPENISYLDTYAWALYKNNNLEMAKIIIEQAIKNGAKNNAVIIEHYGDILYKLNEKEKAFEMWEKAKGIGKGSEFLDKKINDKKLYE